jgi:tetratricopeptide (TPR) repeat protein
LQPRQLTQDDSTLALGELMLRAGGRHEKALALFEKISERNPEDLRARVGQARAHLQARDWQGAAEILESLNGASVPDPETALALAQAYYHQASSTSAGEQKLSPEVRAQIARAKALFDSAMDDKRTRLPAISGYVLASLALDERGDDLILLAQIAYRRAPKSTDLAVALAILHELKEDKATAREYWQQAARIVHTAPMRARILSALQASEP